MYTMGVDCHPCASKQVQNVRFACREQGLGTEHANAAKGAAGERVEVGFEGCSHMSGEHGHGQGHGHGHGNGKVEVLCKLVQKGAD
jgi:hypothetical protein